MIKIIFTKQNSLINAFELSGHSMSAPSGKDIICAFVSSASLMTANTITEIIGLDADIQVDDGYLSVKIKGSPKSAQDILQGFLLHVTELEKDYPQNIKVIISEV